MKTNKRNSLKNIVLNQKAKAVIMFVITFIVLFGIAMIIYAIIGTSETIEPENNEMQVNETNTISQSVNIESIPVSVETLDCKISNISETDNYISLGEFKCTAYCGCEKCCGKYGKNRPKDKDGNDIVYTASGNIAVEGVTIAADTSIFPFGTELYINGHKFTVQDVGEVIKENRIDFYFNDHETAEEFGVKYLEVFAKIN